MRAFKVKMTNPGYYCTTFTLYEISDGPTPKSPKIGDILIANDLLTIVANYNRVIIDPKD